LQIHGQPSTAKYFVKILSFAAGFAFTRFDFTSLLAEDFTESMNRTRCKKKALQAFMPEGLHPVFLTLFMSQHSLLPAEQ
jgi:hypothetical protein